MLHNKLINSSISLIISHSSFFFSHDRSFYYRAFVSRKFRTFYCPDCRGTTSGNIGDGIHRKRKVITRCHWVKYNSKRNAKAVVNRCWAGGDFFSPLNQRSLSEGLSRSHIPPPSPFPPLSQRSFIIQMEFHLSRIVAQEFTDVFVPRLLTPLLTGRNLFDTSGDSAFGQISRADITRRSLIACQLMRIDAITRVNRVHYVCM